MSKKNCDPYNRFRSRTIAFRMSPEEADLLNDLVKVSGYNKQDYLISRVLQREIVVRGSPRTYKALKDKIAEVLAELRQLSSTSEISPELAAVIVQISETLTGFAENN